MQVLGFKGRLRAGILAEVVKAASVVAWEVRAHFDEGLHIRAVNPENVAMVVIDVPISAFESFNGKLTAGLDLDRLKNTIRAFSSRDVLDLQIRAMWRCTQSRSPDTSSGWSSPTALGRRARRAKRRKGKVGMKRSMREDGSS